MKNLLRVQLYRFSRHPLTRYVLLPACILAAIAPICLEHFLRSLDAVEDGNTSFSYAFSDFGGLDAAASFQRYYLLFFCILILIPVTYSVCSAFHSKTVLHERISGSSIHQLLLSRLIVAAGIPFLLALATAALSIGAVTWMHGWKWEYSLCYSRHETICCILLAVFVLLQACLLCVLCCCIAGEASTSLALIWMLYILSFLLTAITLPLLESVLSSVLSEGTFANLQQLITEILPGMPLLLLFRADFDPETDLESYAPVSAHLPAVLIAGVFWIILFYLIAYLRLKYREIREEV